MFVKVPRNETVLRQFGAYPSVMNFGRGRATNVQNQVRRFGLAGFEPSTQATLLALVQLAGVPVEFFDVGAHVGLHSALISTVFPADAVHVTAFEPTPRTAEICSSIAAANGLPIRLERCAVAAEDGTAELFISNTAETSNSLTEGFRDSETSITVPTVSLDSYCAQRGLHPQVMKIDVETLEAQVLLGALETLENSRPAIVCELLRVAEQTATEQALTALSGLGYRMHRWARKGGWRECTAQDVANHVAHAGRDWLFTPDELDPRFHGVVDEWLDAVAECTPDTTVAVPERVMARRAHKRDPRRAAPYQPDRPPADPSRLPRARRVRRRRVRLRHHQAEQ